MTSPKLRKSRLLQETEDERLRSGIITIQKMAGLIEGINRACDNELGNRITRIYTGAPEEVTRAVKQSNVSKTYQKL